MNRHLKNYLFTILMTIALVMSVNTASFAEQTDKETIEYTQEPQIILSEEFVKIASRAETEAVIEELEVLSKQPQPALTATSRVFSEDEYDEMVAFLRDGFKNRETTIVLKYQIAQWDSKLTLASNAVNDAMEHTGVGNEGDYIDRSYGGYQMGASGTYSGGKYTCTVTLTVSYYTTKEQEEELAAEIDKVLTSLNLSGKSDYEKFKLIYDYICANITYDYDHLNDGSYMLQYTAYAALINKTSVCQGYACLLYRMLLQAGVENRIITGIGNGGDHAWNIVKPDEYWYYYVDSTWDATYKQAGRAYQYFLRCLDKFGNHTPALKSGGNYEERITEILNSYPIAGVDYTICTHNWKTSSVEKKATFDEDGEKKLECDDCIELKTEVIRRIGEVSLSDYSYTYDGSAKKPSVIVKDADGNTIAAVNYDTSYAGNVNAGTATVTVTFKNEYEGTVERTFVIKSGNTKPEISLVAGDSSITVSWEAINGATNYRVFTYLNGSYTKIGDTKNTTYTISKLVNGTKYGVLVKAYINGTWVVSDAEHIRYAAPNGSTTDLKPVISSITAGDKKITVKWGAINGATNYRVFTYLNSKYTKIGDTKNTSYTISGLTNGTKYGVLVKACVNGAWVVSDASHIKYTTPTADTKPVISNITAGDKSITVTWGTISGATNYRVFTYLNGTYTKIGDTKNTSYTISGLNNGTKYGVLVKAYVNGAWVVSDTAHIKYATPTA